MDFEDLWVKNGENRQRNVTVKVTTHGETDKQTQTDFIICPMLYGIAMGQITIPQENLFLLCDAAVLVKVPGSHV